MLVRYLPMIATLTLASVSTSACAHTYTPEQVLSPNGPYVAGLPVFLLANAYHNGARGEPLQADEIDDVRDARACLVKLTGQDVLADTPMRAALHQKLQGHGFAQANILRAEARYRQSLMAHPATASLADCDPQAAVPTPTDFS